MKTRREESWGSQRTPGGHAAEAKEKQREAQEQELIDMRPLEEQRGGPLGRRQALSWAPADGKLGWVERAAQG